MTKQPAINKFQAAVEKTIQAHRMIFQNEKILLAVSGGPDSIALARFFISQRHRQRLFLGIAHVNHRLRGSDADRDQNFVKNFAKTHGIEFHSLSKNIRDLAKEKKVSIEEAGRIVRYDYFKKAAGQYEYDKIATGHTKNDNAEQVLMNLLRGSGTRGLSGIPPVRDQIFIRPLIRLTKTQILEYLKDLNQDFCTDNSNFDQAYLRNKIRHDLIPHLQQNYNPSIVDTLDRFSRVLRSEDNYLDKKALELFSLFAVPLDKNSIEMKIQSLNEMYPAIRARVIRQCISTVKPGLRRISLKHLSDIENLCDTAESGKHIDLPGQIRVYKSRNIVRFQKENLPLRQLGKEEKSRG